MKLRVLFGLFVLLLSTGLSVCAMEEGDSTQKKGRSVTLYQRGYSYVGQSIKTGCNQVGAGYGYIQKKAEENKEVAALVAGVAVIVGVYGVAKAAPYIKRKSSCVLKEIKKEEPFFTMNFLFRALTGRTGGHLG